MLCELRFFNHSDNRNDPSHFVTFQRTYHCLLYESHTCKSNLMDGESEGAAEGLIDNDGISEGAADGFADVLGKSEGAAEGLNDTQGKAEGAAEGLLLFVALVSFHDRLRRWGAPRYSSKRREYERRVRFESEMKP